MLRLRVYALECTVGSHRLLRDLSFELPAGQSLLLTGPNGSGKTSLLRAIAGLLRPSDGSIRWRVDTQETADGWLSNSDPAWPAQMLYQGHAPGWKAELTVTENLALQWRLDGIDASPAQIDESLAAVGLAQRRGLAFGHLSAGQRRRLGLARLSLDRRPLWLLDEPATALDESGQQHLAALLDRHLQRRGSAIIATHQRLSLQQMAIELNLSALPPASGAAAIDARGPSDQKPTP